MDSTGILYVIAGTIICFLTGGFVRGTTIVFEAVLRKYRWSEGATAWIFSIERLLIFMFACIPALLVKKCSPRMIVLVGGLLKFAGVALTGLATNMFEVYLTLGVLTAFGSNFCWEPAYITIARHYKKKRGTAFGIMGIGGPLGGFVFPPLMQFLFEYYGFTGAFMVIGALSLNLCVAGALFRPLKESPDICASTELQPVSPETANTSGLNNDVINNEYNNSDRAQTDIYKQEDLKNCYKNERENNDDYFKGCLMKCTVIREFMKDIRFIGMSFVQFAVIFGLVGPTTFLAGACAERGIPIMHCAFLLSMAAAIDIVAKLSFGPIFDHKCIQGKRDYLFGSLVMVVGTAGAALPFARELAAVIGVIFVHSLFTGPVYIQYITVVTDIVGNDRLPEAKSVLGVFQGLGGVLSPIAGGLVKDATGSYDSFFLIAGGIKVFAGFVYVACSLSKHCKRGDNYERFDGS